MNRHRKFTKIRYTIIIKKTYQSKHLCRILLLLYPYMQKYDHISRPLDQAGC